MIWRVITVVVALTSCTTAPKRWTVFVQNSKTMGNASVTQFPLASKTADQDVWKSSESSCACKAEFFENGQQFNYSCTLPDGYRIQAGVECRKHEGEREALYLFVCQNFRIWCEPAT
jgi:hypothetical protein